MFPKIPALNLNVNVRQKTSAILDFFIRGRNGYVLYNKKINKKTHLSNRMAADFCELKRRELLSIFPVLGLD